MKFVEMIIAYCKIKKKKPSRFNTWSSAYIYLEILRLGSMRNTQVFNGLVGSAFHPTQAIRAAIFGNLFSCFKLCPLQTAAAFCNDILLDDNIEVYNNQTGSHLRHFKFTSI
jgi:hypothetical protein